MLCRISATDHNTVHRLDLLPDYPDRYFPASVIVLVLQDKDYIRHTQHLLNPLSDPDSLAEEHNWSLPLDNTLLQGHRCKERSPGEADNYRN